MSIDSQAFTPFLIWVGMGHIAPHASGALHHRLVPPVPIVARHRLGVDRVQALIEAARKAAAQSRQPVFVNAVEQYVQILSPDTQKAPEALGHLLADGRIEYNLPVLQAYAQLIFAAHTQYRIRLEEVRAINGAMFAAVKEDTYVHELSEAILRRSPIAQTLRIRILAMELLRDGRLHPERYGLAADDAVGAAFHLIAQLMDDQGRQEMFSGWLLDLDGRDRIMATELLVSIGTDNPVWIAFNAVRDGTITRADEIRKLEEALRRLPPEAPAVAPPSPDVIPEPAAAPEPEPEPAPSSPRDAYDHITRIIETLPLNDAPPDVLKRLISARLNLIYRDGERVASSEWNRMHLDALRNLQYLARNAQDMAVFTRDQHEWFRLALAELEATKPAAGASVRHVFHRRHIHRSQDPSPAPETQEAQMPAAEPLPESPAVRANGIAKHTPSHEVEAPFSPVSLLGDATRAAAELDRLNVLHRGDLKVFRHLARFGFTEEEIRWVLDTAYWVSEKWTLWECIVQLEIPVERQEWFMTLWNDRLPGFMKSLWPEIRLTRTPERVGGPVRPPLQARRDA